MIRSSALFVLMFLAACSGSVPECRVGADCASGICTSMGTCAKADGGGTASGGGSGGGSGSQGGGTAANGGGSSQSGGGSAQGGGTAAGGGSGTGGGMSPTCMPNHDGTITRMEVPLQAGLHATFKVATNVTLSSAPDTADGGMTWDLSQMLSGDHSVLAETMPVAGQWFANDFAGATYATKLSESQDVLGIFQVADDGLYLMGVASSMSGLTQTKLTYSPPAKMLQFPMAQGDTWTTTSSITGTLNGGAWFQTEQYDMKVDKRGTVITPFTAFDVLRVQTVLTRTVGVVPTVTRQYQFVTECFGIVAVLTSQADETATEFSNQAEVRRLSP
jgi:hypothetical protein